MTDLFQQRYCFFNCIDNKFLCKKFFNNDYFWWDEIEPDEGRIVLLWLHFINGIRNYDIKKYSNNNNNNNNMKLIINVYCLLNDIGWDHVFVVPTNVGNIPDFTKAFKL